MQNDGYVMDMDYIDAYFYGLNPLNIDFNLTLAGIKNTKNSPISYLELGFGKGYSLALHSVCNEGEFVGVDFNPTFALNAKNLAPNATIYNESFKDFYKRAILEKMRFDYIVLHGVWSWVNAKNKKYLQNIIKECLNLGGIVYISYNALPGWEGGFSLQKILKAFSQTKSGTQDTKITKTLDFLRHFSQTPMDFLSANPKAKNEIAHILNQDNAVLAHEFFNHHWSCHHFLDIAETLQKCQCDFASSANVLWHFDSLTLSQEQHALLDLTYDSLLQEQLKDFFVNRKFRADLFLKGKFLLSPKEQESKLLNTAFILLRKDAKIQGMENLASVQQIYLGVLDFLASNAWEPKTLQSIMESCKLPLMQALQILCVMMSYHAIAPTQAFTHAQRQQAKAFNAQAIKQDKERIYLAAPLLGGGFAISKQEAMALQNYLQASLQTPLQTPNAPLDSADSINSTDSRDFADSMDSADSAASTNSKDSTIPNLPLYQRLGIL